jgi:hypothetical protein
LTAELKATDGLEHIFTRRNTAGGQALSIVATVAR